MLEKSRNRTDLENVERGDGAILAAKEKFAEEPPQESGQAGGDDVHHL
jgi:hypothetical protein